MHFVYVLFKTGNHAAMMGAFSTPERMFEYVQVYFEQMNIEGVIVQDPVLESGGSFSFRQENEQLQNFHLRRLPLDQGAPLQMQLSPLLNA